MSGARARDADDPRFQVHHCLPARELRARGLHRYVWDPRNAVWLSKRVHERHETATRPAHRIPRALLPSSVWRFCAELDALDGSEWATALVERLHPDRGVQR